MKGQEALLFGKRSKNSPPCWRGTQSGVAAVEFALCAPLMLMMLAGISDLGLAMRSKMLLVIGVDNATTYAILTQGSATSATLKAIVQDASSLTGVSANASAVTYDCASGTPATLVAATSTTTCASGAVAGQYVTITGSYTYTPLMPGYSFVANTTLSDTATVQVK
jgi:Flp pilus assembly protein TadG